MIPIYKAEQSVPGLADKIYASQSVAYSVELESWTPGEDEAYHKNHLRMGLKAAAEMRGLNLSLASANDFDLYFTKSILVTTNWNRNDDIFMPIPVWAARHTPSHKPTNLEHDEKRMVGHMTDTWAIDAQGKLIPDSTSADELPSLFHLANGAVIYRNWEDKDLAVRAGELIESIEAGKKFVSMEALFSNFGYGIITPEKQFHIVARGTDTAFLTKHLRIYGGSGEYDGCKVGRALMNITFSGKGYVDKPANPYSVIFNDATPFDFSKASADNPFSRSNGVFISCGNDSQDDNKLTNEDTVEKPQMSDTLSVDLLKSQNDELKATVAALSGKVDELTKANSEAGVKALQAELADLKGKLEASQTELDAVKADAKTVAGEKTEIEKQLTEANEAKATLEKEIAEANEAKTKADRISKLVDGGVDKEVATQKVETFASLNDEQFASVAEDVIKAAFPPKDEDKKDEKKDKKDAKASDKSDDDNPEDDPAAANASDDVLDTADTKDEPNLAADASDESGNDQESLRAELRQVFASRLQHVNVEAKE